MTFQAAFADAPTLPRDREIIRVDFANDRFGIAASLRRAFDAAAFDRSTHDFDRLLEELD